MSIEFPSLEEEIRTTVFEALGAASACWENLSGAGVFLSTRCKEIGDQLVKDLDNLYSRKDFTEEKEPVL